MMRVSLVRKPGTPRSINEDHMPADHINIQHPERRGADSDTYRSRLEIEQLRAELKQLRMWYDTLERDLTAIFTRIERGDEAELHYPDGRIFVIAGRERP